jgi:hypothetical protein
MRSIQTIITMLTISNHTNLRRMKDIPLQIILKTTTITTSMIMTIADQFFPASHMGQIYITPPAMSLALLDRIQHHRRRNLSSDGKL